MLTGTYIGVGPEELVGERALLRRKGELLILAQFNDLEKFSKHENDWALGWHTFLSEHFDIEEDTE